MDAARGVVADALRAANGDVLAAVSIMMRRNPQFAEFMRTNAGKTPEQVAREHGIDISGIRL